MNSTTADNQTKQPQAQSRLKKHSLSDKPKSEKVRAELNVERWPAMWQPAKSKTRAAVRTFSREMTFSDGSRGTAQLEVGFTQFGTVTTEDQRMLYALVKQWEDKGKPTAQVFFSDRLLARLLKKSWGTNVIDAITGSLRRLRLTPFRWIKSYHRSDTPNKQVEEEVPFTLLSDLRIIRRKTDGHVTNQQGYFQFDRNLLENLLANYTKPLLLDEFFKLKSEIGQLIYSHIDLIMADKSRYERCSKDLFQDLGLAELTFYRHASHRKQGLARALKELQGIQLSTGVLKSAAVERTKDGKDYKVIFQKGGRASAEAEEDTIASDSKTRAAESQPLVVINDYSKPTEMLIKQAEALVRFFHVTVHGVENHYPQTKEINQASSLISQHGVEDAQHVISYAASRAIETNFKIQHFGAVLSYSSRALAERRQSSPRPIAQAGTKPGSQGAEQRYPRGESRLASLTKGQYEFRAERAKREVLQSYPFLAEPGRQGSSLLAQSVRARIVRELHQEPMDLMPLSYLPDWLRSSPQNLAL